MNSEVHIGSDLPDISPADITTGLKSDFSGILAALSFIVYTDSTVRQRVLSNPSQSGSINLFYK